MFKQLLDYLVFSDSCCNIEEDKFLEIATQQFRNFSKSAAKICGTLSLFRIYLVFVLKDDLPIASILAPFLSSLLQLYLSQMKITNLKRFYFWITLYRALCTLATFEVLVKLQKERIFHVFVLIQLLQHLEALQEITPHLKFYHNLADFCYFLLRAAYENGINVSSSDISLLFIPVIFSFSSESLLSILIKYVNEKMQRIQNLETRWSTLLQKLKVGIGVFSERDLSLQYFNSALQTFTNSQHCSKEVIEVQLRNLVLVNKEGDIKEEIKMEEFLKEIIKMNSTNQQQIEGQSQLQSKLLKRFIENDQRLILKIKENKKMVEIQYQAYKENSESLIMIMLQEVTAVKKLQKSKNLERMKTIYFCSVAHDLKTPLNSIISTNEHLLNQFQNNQSVSKLLRVNYSSCQFLLNIIDDITDLSRIELNEFSLKNKWFKISEILEEIKSVMSIPFSMKKLTFQYSLQDSVSDENTLLLSDPKRLKQILLNLVSNAFKFTSSGGISIKATLRNHLQNEALPLSIHENDGEMEEGDLNDELFENGRNLTGDSRILEVQVTDTGIGIKPDDIPKLFRLFGKLSCSNNVNESGIGLGLTICKKLSQLLGGDIKVESVNGQGTTFIFTIQVKVKHEEAQSHDASFFSVMLENEHCLTEKIEALDSDRVIRMTSLNSL